MIEIRFQVEPGCHLWRLDRYLQHKIRRLSRTRITRIIRQILWLNGAPVQKAGVKVRRGDEILIRRPAPEEPDVPRVLRVIAEGPGYLAVDKPAGLPVHPTARYLHNTLTGLVRERFGPSSGLNMAHRLDRETSGVVLFGRDSQSTRAMKAAFREGRVEKGYLAIVHGEMTEPRVVDLPVGPAPGSEIRIRMGPSAEGQPALTRFEPRRRLDGFTLVEAFPETGRQHQIRVHLEAIGLPLVGDKLYGHPDSFFLELVEQGMTPSLQKALLLPRHALHAAWIRFPGPEGPPGEMVRIEAPLPEDMQAFLGAAAEPA